MTDKNAMICDLKTGICGSTEEGNSFMELIDLTAPNSDIKEEVIEKNNK